MCTVFQKTHPKEMCDYLTLKMLPLALALIKTKINNFLIHWSKNPLFYGKMFLAIKNFNFSCEMRIFLTYVMGQKDGDFLF